MIEVRIYRRDVQSFQCPHCRKVCKLRMPKKRKTEKEGFFTMKDW